MNQNWAKMKSLKGKRAILYRRVSTTDQKDYGNSLNSQQTELHKFCASHSIEIVKDFQEDYSAKDFYRPVFTKLIQYATLNKNRIDYLLVYQWDRFSRSTVGSVNMVELFRGMNIEVNSINQWVNHDDAHQHLVYMFYISMPEVDNRIRRDRTIEGTRSNLKEGRWVLNQPKGYVPGRDETGKVLMKPDPKIAPLISELFKDFSLGIYSQNELRKLPKFKPLELTKSGISRILNQPLYSGKIIVPAYKDEPEQMVDAIHEPLISEEIFEKVQYELGQRKRIKHKPVKQNDLLPMRGYLSCNKCGSNLTGSGSKSKTGKKHYYYHCNPRNGCNERFKVALAHNSIQDTLDSLKPKEEVINLFEYILKNQYENSEKSNKSTIKKIDDKITKLKNRKDILLDRYLDGHIDNDTYNSKSSELSHQINDLVFDKNQLDQYEKDEIEYIDFGIYMVKHLGTLYDKGSLPIKQKLLSSIFKEKLVFDGEKYRTPKLNKGIELITSSIKGLESIGNKNGRPSFDNLPLSTWGGNRTRTLERTGF